MAVYRTPPYDALRDFTGVSVFSESTNILVVPASLSARSLRELVALARERPGALNYSSAGAGVTQHLAAEPFNLRPTSCSSACPFMSSAAFTPAHRTWEHQPTFCLS